MIVPPPPAPPYVAPDLRAIESAAYARLTKYYVRVRRHYQLVDTGFENPAWVGADNAPLEVRIHRNLAAGVTAEQAFYNSGDRGAATAADVAGASTEAIDVTPLDAGFLGKVPRFLHVVVRRHSDQHVLIDWTGPFCATDVARLDDVQGPADSDLAPPCADNSDSPIGKSRAAARLVAVPVPVSKLRQWRLGWAEGIDRGWALQLQLPERLISDLPNGTHDMTITINPDGVVNETSSANNTITTPLVVRRLKFRNFSTLMAQLSRARRQAARMLPAGAHRPVRSAPATAGTLRAALGVPLLPGGHAAATARAATPPPPNVDLPDLRSAPAFSIAVRNGRKHDYLRFSALEWNDGPGKLEVEAFRTQNSPTLAAYQVFYSGWTRTTRQARGSMEFDHGDGHHHFHFNGFARYSIVGAGSDSTVVTSTKRSWCVAPTDLVDSTRPGFSALSALASLQTSCGSAPGSIWARQALDVGFGDTYDQDKGGQAFDITNIPNGRYRLKVEVNPDQLLAEGDYSNNATYRTIYFTGAAHHRHVHVPADPILGKA